MLDIAEAMATTVREIADDEFNGVQYGMIVPLCDSRFLLRLRLFPLCLFPILGGLKGPGMPSSVEGGMSGLLPEISGDVDVPSVDVKMPSVGLAGKLPDMPSAGGDISGELTSADVKATAPNVNVQGPDGSLTPGLAAGAVAGLGAIGAGLGLMSKGDKPEGKVRVCGICSGMHGERPTTKLSGFSQGWLALPLVFIDNL